MFYFNAISINEEKKYNKELLFGKIFANIEAPKKDVNCTLTQLWIVSIANIKYQE